MHRKARLKSVVSTVLVLSLMGCQTLPTGVAVTASTAPVLRPGADVGEKIFPGVLIRKAKPKAVLDAVLRERAKKRMVVKKRDIYLLHMTMRVPHTKRRTEAQMVYTLHRYQDGLWLSVKVYQIADLAGGSKEILDVTQRVAKEVQQELNKIAAQWAK